ncbi:hypothetical protein PMA4326_007185 [Pseudomonas syringae pv. maculicola str. ES4326]|uniref:Uncharacterized protein n=1 Tax=Pseudomonas syringae pv. maculicola str. ES4326 TaxID=629265 RepID=A0A8T8BZ94_PSEYM|nr:hypothetical protein PMA4326_007185 [Pseudomonas syringae pv. maculicola str. ES4326]
MPCLTFARRLFVQSLAQWQNDPSSVLPDTGKKTAPPLPLCLSTAEMPCRFSGMATFVLPATLANIGFCNMARRLLCQ